MKSIKERKKEVRDEEANKINYFLETKLVHALNLHNMTGIVQ
jgi:hypothetical protein